MLWVFACATVAADCIQLSAIQCCMTDRGTLHRLVASAYWFSAQLTHLSAAHQRCTRACLCCVCAQGCGGAGGRGHRHSSGLRTDSRSALETHQALTASGCSCTTYMRERNWLYFGFAWSVSGNCPKHLLCSCLKQLGFSSTSPLWCTIPR
jgi:hypothetical protein